MHLPKLAQGLIHRQRRSVFNNFCYFFALPSRRETKISCDVCMYTCMYVCIRRMYVFMYACMYVFMYVSVRVCTDDFLFLHCPADEKQKYPAMYVCMYVCVCVRVYIHIDENQKYPCEYSSNYVWVCMCVCIHTQTNKNTHTYSMHAHKSSNIS